jgi:protein phosphatase 1L
VRRQTKRRLRRAKTRRQRGGALVVGKFQADGSKKPNEDTMTAITEGTVAVVCVFDGHGGPHCSRYIEARLPEIIHTKAAALGGDSAAISTMLKEEFATFDELIKKERWAEETGSTGTVCVVTATEIIVANVGDSPAVVFTAESQLLHTTVDHDCDNPEEAARVIAAGGHVSEEEGDVKRVNGELAVSRAFGDFSLKPYVIVDPQTYVWPRVAGTFLGICSDGLTEKQTESGIEHAVTREELAAKISAGIRTSPNLSAASRKIVQEQADQFISNSGHYQGDNVSLVIAAL